MAYSSENHLPLISRLQPPTSSRVNGWSSFMVDQLDNNTWGLWEYSLVCFIVSWIARSSLPTYTPFIEREGHWKQTTRATVVVHIGSMCCAVNVKSFSTFKFRENRSKKENICVRFVTECSLKYITWTDHLLNEACSLKTQFFFVRLSHFLRQASSRIRNSKCSYNRLWANWSFTQTLMSQLLIGWTDRLLGAVGLCCWCLNNLAVVLGTLPKSSKIIYWKQSLKEITTKIIQCSGGSGGLNK